MARVVLVGTPGKLTEVRPQDVPDDLRGAYFGDPPGYGEVNAASLIPPLGPPTLHLMGDWSKKDMTDVSVVHADVADWAPPGHRGEWGHTGNHGIYLRWNENLERMISPEYIPFGEHEMIASFLFQEAERHLATNDDRRVMEESAAKLLDYRQSWAPMRATEPNMMRAARIAFKDHPEMMEWCEKVAADPELVKGQRLDLGNGIVVDEAFLASLNLPVPLHDRWEYERYLESYLPQFLTFKATEGRTFRVHIWRMLPLRLAYTLSADPDWWLGRFGG